MLMTHLSHYRAAVDWCPVERIYTYSVVVSSGKSGTQS